MSPLRTTVLALTASGCGALTSEDASGASGPAVGQKADLGFIDADGTVVSEGYLDDDELRAEAAEIAG